MQFGLIPSGFVADCGCPDRQQAYQDFMWLTAGRRFVTANLYAFAAAETSAGMRLIRTSADGAALYSFPEPTIILRRRYRPPGGGPVAGERCGPAKVGSEVKGPKRSSDTESHHQMD